LEQIGQSPTAAQLGNTFATVLNTAPFDKLTFVKKIGFNVEKDFKKDLVLLGGFDWKEYTPLGISTYIAPTTNVGVFDTLKKILPRRNLLQEYDGQKMRSFYPDNLIEQVLAPPFPSYPYNALLA
jgi:hypothetical protein